MGGYETSREIQALVDMPRKHQGGSQEVGEQTQREGEGRWGHGCVKICALIELQFPAITFTSANKTWQ